MTAQRQVDRKEKDKRVRDIKALVATTMGSEFSDVAMAAIVRLLQKQDKEALARHFLKSYFSCKPEAWDRLMQFLAASEPEA